LFAVFLYIIWNYQQEKGLLNATSPIADRRWILCFDYQYVLALKTLSLFNVYAETSCKNGIIYNSTCYKIHRELANWFTAVNRCLSNNGSLAVFDDNITTYFAFNTFLPRGALWIGLIKSWWTWPDAGLYSLQWHQQDVCRVCMTCSHNSWADCSKAK